MDSAEKVPLSPAADTTDVDESTSSDFPLVFDTAGRSAASESRVRRGNTRDVWALLGCNAIVFVTSVCIMVLELTASRLISKSVGSSLYTWTSVIGVVLAGISAGNFLGGWLADRYTPRKTLGWLFWTASALCLAVYPLHTLVGSGGRPEGMSLPMWVLCVVTAVFLLPSVALGTISPVVASMALARSTRTGMTVGNVYAWGALGSIVGTFLTGFFLISSFGTQHIIWMTAATLAVMGVLIASGQWFYRGVMLFGWLQLVVWIGLFASIRERGDSAAAAGDTAEEGVSLPGAFHGVGLAMKLRSDAPDEYNDESDYFYINVANRREGGDIVRALHLDHLVHSYWNPQQPTKLYYDYEKVYAGITERAAGTWDRTTSVTLPEFPAGADPETALPAWAKYDPAQRTLTVRGALSETQRDMLLKVSPAAPYWLAVRELTSTENENLFSSMSSAMLETLPEGIQLPEKLAGKIRYDKPFGALMRYELLSDEDAATLLALGPDQEYRTAVERLYEESRQVSTLFIGGGGFVFPRWIEAKFPYRPRIDVAELDPAVKKAVQQAMGLPPDDQTAIRTVIGDARNFVDDRVRENARLVAAGKSPIYYDFAYGDAFNDFSVPAHLTTREFTAKVKSLLTPGSGAYLMNIIDIYARPVFPTGEAGRGEVRVPAALPRFLTPASLTPGEWTRAPAPCSALEIRTTTSGEAFDIRYTGVMSEEVRDQLTAALENKAATAANDQEVRRAVETAIHDLYHLTREPALYLGTLPDALTPSEFVDYEWTTAPAPYASLELEPHPLSRGENDLRPAYGYRLGYRGVMSERDEQQLLELAGEDADLARAIRALAAESRRSRAGGFLGAFVATVCEEFPYVYVYSSNIGRPADQRDTFVVACSLRKLDLTNLGTSGGYWDSDPFAAMETDGSGTRHYSGQMAAVLQLARGITLTDDYAPVENLLLPVFSDQ